MRGVMGLFVRLHQTLCGPKLLHVVLPAVMVYLFIGTVAQKYVGLYEATRIWFSATVIWIGSIPLPGMPILMALIFVNLAFKLVFKSPWTVRNAGNIITHVGALLLLLGGLFTALYSSEGYIALGEGENKSAVSDYHMREFVILNKGGDVIRQYEHAVIAKGALFVGDLPFQIKVIEWCENCQIIAREAPSPEHMGMAQHMQLSPAPPRMNNEDNFSGLTFEISYEDRKEIHVALEGIGVFPEVIAGGRTYLFALRRAQRALPFTISLIDFEKITHPGTDTAKEYRSTVLIQDSGLQWESEISMNAPLRYKGYTFFQSSFLDTPNGEVSVLAVVWNVGRAFPYISGIVMCIGLLLHLFLRLRFAAIALFVLLPLFFSAPVYAESLRLSLDDFSRVPILHDGRVKPVESFARAMKKRFSGTDSGAMEWLVQSLFDPARSEGLPILRITNPDLLGLLSLERRENRMYSYAEIYTALGEKQPLILNILKAEEDDWSPQHRSLIALQQDVVALRDVLSSLSGVLPLYAPLPEGISTADGRVTYFNLLGQRPVLDHALRLIVQTKGEDVGTYSVEEQKMAELSFKLSAVNEASKISKIFKVVPIGEDWQTVWQAIKNNTVRDARYVEYWHNLAKAYHGGRSDLWDIHVAALLKSYESQEQVSLPSLMVERFYVEYDPFKIAFVFCIIALILLFARGFKAFSPALITAPLVLCVLAQIAGIGMRMFILWRPPVSTLYETVLFVTPIVMAYLIMLYRRSDDGLWLWLAAIGGALLLMLGFAHQEDGDSFVMLTAVLNTNFWLTTHVLTITAGYAFCALTALMAHYILVSMVWMKKCQPDFALFQSMHAAALIALFFATIGTVLGGIWADQSWGRFWGWDPKENGALLIVLWLVWAVHGRISGQLGHIGVLYAMSFLSVILALSWFGVNLLSVGLHAYGFTDSMAVALGVFIAAELVFLGGIHWLFIKPQLKKERAAHG